MAAFWQLVRTDLTLYFTNRRAVIMNVLAPVAIAAFFGYLFGPRATENPSRVPIAVVDLDGSALSKAIVAALGADPALEVRAAPSEPAAVGEVAAGHLTAAIVLPAGFGAAAPRAMFGGVPPVPVTVHNDPSQATTLRLVEGLFAKAVMQSTGEAMFSPQGSALGDLRTSLDDRPGMDPQLRTELLDLYDRADRVQARRQALGGQARTARFTLPYAVVEKAATARRTPYNSYAHSFAGMGVQFILMMAVDLGVGVLLLRRLGLWTRLRAAPLGRSTFLGARFAMIAIAAFVCMAAIYAVAFAAFGVRIHGSLPGFVAVLASFCLMTASLGLLIAAIGRTPEATRGLAILATLLLVMLGGAWVPTFVFPPWLAALTAYVPTRWAVDGLDAMTWRGLPLASAVFPVLGMTGVAAGALAVAILKFRWDE
jgi:ABC-2 type transport system permease protein